MRDEDVAFLEGMKQTLEATYYYGPLHKPQRNSPERANMLVGRAERQRMRAPGYSAASNKQATKAGYVKPNYRKAARRRAA